MNDIERLSAGIVAADRAGDVETVRILGKALRAAQMGPQQPERTGWERTGRSLALGTRNAIEGIAALPGIFVDAASVPQRLLGYEPPRFSEAVSRGFDAMGFPRAENQTERVVGRVVQEASAAIPTMGAGVLMSGARAVPQLAQQATNTVMQGSGIIPRFVNAVTSGAQALRQGAPQIGGMLAANPGTQFVAGAGSGLAAQTANEAGAGPITEAVAGMGGGLLGGLAFEAAKGIGRLGRAALEPFTQGGRDRITGNALYASGADPESMMARIQAGMDDQSRRVPGAPVTTAQAAQDPGLAVLESGMRNDATGANSPGILLRDVEFRRNQARQNAMQGLQPLPGVDAATRGGTVRTALSEAEGANLPGGAANFVRQFLGRATGASDDFYGNLDALAQTRTAASRPLYEKAMSNNAWSPRVDDFLTDPISKEGLKRGFAIQRREAIAEGRPFNPNQLGVTFNDAGDPVFVGRPNMRVLDMVKAGLDDIIEGYRDKTTGILRLDRTGAAIDKFRKSYVNVLDDLNPDYRAARQSWAGPSQAMDALADGRSALRMDPEQVAKRMATMGDGDKDFYRAGLLRDLQDMFARGDAQAFAMFRDANKRKVLETVFGRENIDGLAGHLNEHASRFGRDGSGANAVGRILATDGSGNPTLPVGNVTGGAVQNLQSVRQTLSAVPAGPQREQVRKALQSEFIERFNSAAQTSSDVVGISGDRTRALSPAAARKFFEQNAAVAREIFSPQELQQINRLMADFGETAGLQATAAARGSPTAQNLIVGNMVSRATGGLVDPANPTAQTVLGLGPTMRLLYASPEAQVRENLARAIASPQDALRYLRAAGPEGAQQGAAYMNQSMKDRLARALMGEMVRGAARTGNALAVQQQSGP